MFFEIYDVKVAFLRRGPWIGATETASAAAVANPAVLSITMPSTAAIASPIEIDFTGFTVRVTNGHIYIPPGFIFVGPQNAFSLQEGEAGVKGLGAATYTSTADASVQASGGNVGRLNTSAASVGYETFLQWQLPAAFATATRVAIYVTYRNNSATPFTMRGAAYNLSYFSDGYTVSTPITNQPSTPLTLVAAGPSDPAAVYLGAVASRYGFTTLDLAIIKTSTAGTGIIDIDTILVADLSSGLTYVLAHPGVPDQFLVASLANKNAQVVISFDPAVSRDPEGRVDVLTTTFKATLTMRGDMALTASGSVINAIWYAPHSVYWTTQNEAFSAKLSIGATVTRRLAFLGPQ
jgi:hypothetical protein